MLFFLLIAVSLASNISLGDRLWCQGNYKEANETWRLDINSSNPAEIAQSHYRQLLSASNLGWAVQGVLGDTALAECPLNDPKCALANVDREIFLHIIGLPSDLEYAKTLSEKLLPHLPAESTARLVWFKTLPQEALHTFEQLDGFGHCMSQDTNWDRGPGGAYIGFGMYGGGQLGVGGSVGWTQPNIDNGGGNLQTSLAITTKAAGGLFVSYTSVGDSWIQVSTNIQRRPFYQYQDDVASFHLVETGTLSLRPGFSWETGQVWAGGFARIEGEPIDWANGNDWRAIGISIGGIWKPHPTIQFKGNIDYTEWQYHHLRLDGQMMWIHPTGWAALFDVGATPNTDAPWWRLPTVGGGNVLRTPPAHRWRNEFLPAAVLEYRFKPQNTFGIVPFAEMAYIANEFHGGGGLGLRIRLPPQPHNTMRFDIGYGDSGWNILFGAEEFFRFGLF